MPARTIRSEKLDLRLTRDAKRALHAAAAGVHRSVSEFVLESGLARADEALAERGLSVSIPRSGMLSGRRLMHLPAPSPFWSVC
jgi:uncharacterized protein (DUF1778 family)